MIVPLNWLQDYIDITESPEEIARAFTSIGYMLDRPIATENGTPALDLEVRQNRSDCLSMIGLARELGAILNRDIRLPDSLEQLPDQTGNTQVEIEDPQLCERFLAVTIENVKVGQSPEWLTSRLEAYGVKSINTIVDITNFVAIEYGQPMHAYDADKVKNRHIVVRHAQEGEKLTLFGGKVVTFSADDSIHADADGPIGFGAIMGGEAKSVHDDTTSIILEAAVYDQASVRRSSRRHSIRTEASTRLEKFIHPQLVEIALKRAVHLILELANGNVTSVVDTYDGQNQEKRIALHIDQVERLAGVSLSLEEVESILNRLELYSERSDDGALIVNIPYFRTDLEQEADLVEEVIRIHGYDKIPERLPHAAPPQDIQSAAYMLEESVRDILIALGYDEVITEPLTQESDPDRTPVTLENSLTSEKTMLRTTMLPSLLTALQERRKYRTADIRLFEVGKIYYQHEGKYVEQRTLGLITSGKHTYLDVKGDLELLFTRLGFDSNTFAPLAFESIVSPSAQTWSAEVNLEVLVGAPRTETKRVLSSPPQFIFHDFAIVMPSGGDVTKLLDDVRALDPMIRSVEYIRSQKTDESMKEVIIKVGYSRENQKLSEADVAHVREKIQELSASRV